jgi:hypothetical protein
MDRISFLSKLLLGISVIGATAGLLAQTGYAQKYAQKKEQYTQKKEQKERFVIEITDPKNGGKVDKETPVEGTARLPSGYHLWVLARRSDHKPLWFPQQEAEVDPKTHKWSATAVFGEPQDIGFDYDIGVIAVDSKAHAALTDYKTKAAKTGDWKAIDIPPGSSPPQIVTVKKVSH